MKTQLAGKEFPYYMILWTFGYERRVNFSSTKILDAEVKLKMVLKAAVSIVIRLALKLKNYPLSSTDQRNQDPKIQTGQNLKKNDKGI